MSSTNEAIAFAAIINDVASALTGLTNAKDFDPLRPFALVPANFKAENLIQYAENSLSHEPTPGRVRKNIIFTDVGSFIAYVQSFRVGKSPRLFVTTDKEGITIMAVLDYDVPGAGEPQSYDTQATQPRWNEDIVTLKLAYSRDYKELRDKADDWFEQEEFALFVEENQHLFIEPDAATMLELAQHLKGHRNVTWESGKRLKDGKLDFQYKEVLEGKIGEQGNVEIPDYLLLSAPLFEGFDAQEIKLAFRWRLTQTRAINFGYRLLTKVAERKAEDEVKAKVAEATALPLYAVANFEGIRARKF